MADITALHSELHRNLRVVTKRGAEYGENTHIVPVVADELRNLALEYPVVLVKDNESGRFSMCAMLGFDQGENLFLDGDEWDAVYVPIQVRGQPFSLSYTAEKDGKPDPTSLVISLDMDSNRVQEEEGEKLFNEDGSGTPFLQRISNMLAEFRPAAASTEAFIDTLAKHDLVEAAQLDVQFPGGEKRRFEGLYTVHDEKLSKLEDDVLTDLYKRGYLQAAWLLLASIGNVRKLIMRRGRRHAAAS
ncbi:MAG: SapC family protein [Woeseiaceae bacterium]